MVDLSLDEELTGHLTRRLTCYLTRGLTCHLTRRCHKTTKLTPRRPGELNRKLRDANVTKWSGSRSVEEQRKEAIETSQIMAVTPVGVCPHCNKDEAVMDASLCRMMMMMIRDALRICKATDSAMKNLIGEEASLLQWS